MQENSEKTYGRKSAGKGRNSAGNGRKYPELQSQQKDVSRVKWTEKTWMDGISYRICLDKNLCPLKFQVYIGCILELIKSIPQMVVLLWFTMVESEKSA